jgi:hypothetical protein
MKTKLSLSILLSFYFCLLSSQIPQGFNYQAAARDGAGQPIKEVSLPVRITIQTTPTGGTIMWQETRTALTDPFGVMSFVVGGPGGVRTDGLPSFSQISWASQTLYIKTEIKFPVTNSNYTDLGTTQIWSVPYSLVSKNLQQPVSKFTVSGKTSSLEEAIFEVKNTLGKTVFAVYDEGVRVNVDDGSKGSKGGFAVGSQADGKAVPQNFLVVKKDSVRIFIDDTPGKAGKGGFAVGGFSEGKAIDASYLKISTDETGIINPAENRILWYPLKNAFLTGNVLIASPADVGLNSFSTGYRAKAKGQYSQSMGYLTQALGSNSTAIGKNALAQGNNSFALGDGAQALMADSYSFGAGARASGIGSYAIGSVGRDTATLLPNSQPTDASGEYSFAIGFGAMASGKAATSLGVNSNSTGDAALALGVSSVAQGAKSTALGAGQALGLYSFASGYMSKAEGKFSVAIGHGINKPPKIVVYNHAAGDYSMALGYSRAYGFSSVAIGTATVNSNYGYGMGHSVDVNGTYATAFGVGTTGESYMSTAMGVYNVPSGSQTEWVTTDPLFVIGNGTSPSTTSNALTILKNGNIGIGITSPTHILHINGVGRSSSPSWATSSDIRVKENINSIVDGLDKIMRLNPVTFQYKSDYVDLNPGYEGTFSGFIAQEVKDIIPESVTITSEKLGDKIINDFMLLNQGDMIPLMVEAIKEQQRQIESLKAEIEALKEKK